MAVHDVLGSGAFPGKVEVGLHGLQEAGHSIPMACSTVVCQLLG